MATWQTGVAVVPSASVSVQWSASNGGTELRLAGRPPEGQRVVAEGHI